MRKIKPANPSRPKRANLERRVAPGATLKLEKIEPRREKTKGKEEGEGEEIREEVGDNPEAAL